MWAVQGSGQKSAKLPSLTVSGTPGGRPTRPDVNSLSLSATAEHSLTSKTHNAKSPAMHRHPLQPRQARQHAHDDQLLIALPAVPNAPPSPPRGSTVRLHPPCCHPTIASSLAAAPGCLTACTTPSCPLRCLCYCYICCSCRRCHGGNGCVWLCCGRLER